MSHSSEGASPVIAFDIGGTWCRSAVVSPENDILAFDRVPAPSYARFPRASTIELQEMLIEYLVAEAAARLRTSASDGTIGVSLGAAVDTRTGNVIGASPLWGPTDRLDFNIHERLRAGLSDCTWAIVNDVTAAALGAATLPQYGALRRFALITVSSGLAMRTLEPSTGRTPMSIHSGLQGEVGHLPATFAFNGSQWSRECACGGMNHLSSFASGRGITALLQDLCDDGHQWLAGAESLEAQFASAVAAAEQEAMDLLAAVTEPLARTILAVFTIDADVEKVLLTGGVVDGLGEPYMTTLLRHLTNYGLYGSATHTVDEFRALVQRVPAGFEPTLRGAAAYARRDIGMARG